MDRAIPSFNRLIVEKMQQRNMQTHYQKLFNIHHSKRTRTETSCKSTKPNPKREQLIEERSTDIDKNNVILFQKMSKIMHRPDPLNSNPKHLKINSRRFAEHLQRVNSENQQFLERLCKLKPTIDNKKFLQERKKQIAILKSLGRNSYHGGSSQKAESVNTLSMSKRVQGTEREREEICARRVRRDMEESLSMGKFSSSFMLNPRPRYTEGDCNDLRESQEYFKRELVKLDTRMMKVQSSLDQYSYQSRVKDMSGKKQLSGRQGQKESVFKDKSIVLFATFKKIQSCIYKVEIHRRHKAYEVVAIQVDSVDGKITATFDQAQGNALLSSIDYDYQTLVDGLHVDGGKLLLKLQGRAVQGTEQGEPAMRITNQANRHLSHITQQSNEQQSVTGGADTAHFGADFMRTFYNR